jgi:hypothetical protein
MVAIDTGVMAGLPRDGGATSAGNFGILSAIVVSALIAMSIRLAWLELRDCSVRSRMAASELLGND